ncbi:MULTISPECIES: diguanylate cyclase [unclassified Rhizobium]|uniref:sensor domain-containing diguanylate cyclase n=1 Tax=unclassified Rhizobium TaxID=2613769 RepID=UPI002413DEDF|nr:MULTISPECIES: diguanylate cyclase [unclassified Rhizobium]
MEGTSRSVAFCDHTISLKMPLIVQDASVDARFKDNPLVTGEPKIRFYAGVPLSFDGELFLGALCVIDTVPRIPSDEQVQQLTRLGCAVEGLLAAHFHLTAAKAANEEANRQTTEAKRRETLLEQVERMAAIGAWRIDIATNDVIWSDQIRVLHELEDGETVSLEKGLEFYPEPDRTHVRSAVQDAIILGKAFEIEADFITARGRKRRIRSIGDVEVLNGAPAHIIGTFQDITDRKLTDAKLASIGRILDHSSNELYVFDAETLKFVLVNRGARENLGYSSEEVLDLTPIDIKPEMTQASFEAMIGPLVRQETASLSFETSHKRKDGSVYLAEIHLHFAAGEQPPVFIAIVQDVTQRKAKDNYIQELAFFDALTGLANRTLLLDHLRPAVERGKQATLNVCLLFLDLDRFKEINDTRGHSVGDEVPIEVARRFQSTARGSETLARIDSDEFVLVVENVSESEVLNLVGRLRHSLAAPVIASGKPHSLDVSIGVAQYPKDSSSAEELLQLADIAMYEAKVTGSHHRLYDARMKSAVAKSHDIAERT